MYSSQLGISSRDKSSCKPLLFYLCLAITQVHIAESKLLLPKTWEVTQVKLDRLSYAWSLDIIIPSTIFDTCIKSREFSSTQNSNHKWILEVCSPMPRNSNDMVITEADSPRFKYGISLIYLSGEPQTVEVNYTLTLINGTYNEIYTSNGVIKLQQRQNGHLYEYYDLGENSLNLPNISDLIISVEASLAYKSDRIFSSAECSVTSPTARLRLQSEYNKPEYENLKGVKNFVIQTKDVTKITTSLDLISVLSPIWHQKLLYHTNRRGYVDFDFEVVNETLHFLYHGEAPQMKKMARELFKMAKYVELEELKKLAEEELCNNLTLNLDDIVSSLIFAHEEGVISVKSRIIKYIASQPANILKTQPLKQLKESHPYLIQDILNARTEMAVE